MNTQQKEIEKMKLIMDIQMRYYDKVSWCLLSFGLLMVAVIINSSLGSPVVPGYAIWLAFSPLAVVLYLMRRAYKKEKIRVEEFFGNLK